MTFKCIGDAVPPDKIDTKLIKYFKPLELKYKLNRSLFKPEEDIQYIQFTNILRDRELSDIVEFLVRRMRKYKHYGNEVYEFEDFPVGYWENTATLSSKDKMYAHFTLLYDEILDKHIEFYTNNPDVPVGNDGKNYNKHILIKCHILKETIAGSKNDIMKILLTKLDISQYYPPENTNKYFIDSIEFIDDEKSFIPESELVTVYNDWYRFSESSDVRLNAEDLKDAVIIHINCLNITNMDQISTMVKLRRISKDKKLLPSWNYLQFSYKIKQFMNIMYHLPVISKPSCIIFQ